MDTLQIYDTYITVIMYTTFCDKAIANLKSNFCPAPSTKKNQRGNN